MRLYRVYVSLHIACKYYLHISHSQREYIALPLGKQYQRAAVAVGRLGVVYKTNNNACYGVSIARYFAGERPAAQLVI